MMKAQQRDDNEDRVASTDDEDKVKARYKAKRQKEKAARDASSLTRNLIEAHESPKKAKESDNY